MFYIYRFYKAQADYLIWYHFTPVRKFTSTLHCEIYLKALGYSLFEICRDFCYRWFPHQHNPMLIEYKSEVLYPGLKSKLSYRKAALYGR